MSGASQSLERLLEAYRTFDPVRWVAAYELLPPWGGVVAIVLGIALLLAGGGRLFRVVAGPLGALVGVLWVYPVLSRLGVTVAKETLLPVAAATLAVLGLALPPSAVFFAFGLPAGMLAGELAGPSEWLLGFLPGLLVVGTVASIFTRQVGAVASSILGAWILVLGVLSALRHFGGLSSVASAKPYGILGAAAIFALAGCAYQLVVKPSPEEEAALKAQRLQQKQRRAEKKSLEKRWANYTAKREK